MGGVRGVDSGLPGWALIDDAALLGVCSDVCVATCLDPRLSVSRCACVCDIGH